MCPSPAARPLEPPVDRAVNRQVRLVRRPEGRPTPDVFRLGEGPVPAVGPGQFLVRNAYLSIDPALVSRMRDESNYAESVTPGEVMHAYAVGQVVESRCPGIEVGEVRLGRFDMQELALCDDPAGARKIDLGLAEASWYLGSVGVTGATAYFGLLDVGRPRPGDTVVVSSGGGSVGTAVAQLARMHGCRTVAIVSTDEKAERCRREWGYDAAASYRGKAVEELARDLVAACPDGVDVYFDNTGGDISEALLDLYNDHARIVVCGRMGLSHLDDTRLDRGRRDHNVLLTKRMRKQGLVLLDYQRRMPEALLRLAKWVRQGDLRFGEDVLEGIEQAPAAFFRMLNGENRGKQLVRLAPIDRSLVPGPTWPGRLVTSRYFPTHALAGLVGRVAAAPH